MKTDNRRQTIAREEPWLGRMTDAYNSLGSLVIITIYYPPQAAWLSGSHSR